MEVLSSIVLRKEKKKMITFTAGLFITFIIGYFVIKGLIGFFKGIGGGIAKIFRKEKK